MAVVLLCRHLVMSQCGAKCCSTCAIATLKWHSRQLQHWRITSVLHQKQSIGAEWLSVLQSGAGAALLLSLTAVLLDSTGAVVLCSCVCVVVLLAM